MSNYDTFLKMKDDYYRKVLTVEEIKEIMELEKLVKQAEKDKKEKELGG